MSRARATTAAALALAGALAVIVGCALITWPLGLVALGAALLAAGLLLDVGRRT